MPDAPPILAYEPTPPPPRRRFMRMILTPVFAHCLACYFVAAGLLFVGWYKWGVPIQGATWLHRLPTAPYHVPKLYLSYFMDDTLFILAIGYVNVFALAMFLPSLVRVAVEIRRRRRG